jgi:copper chaperone CopZ
MRISLLSILFISASNLASAESATHKADGDHGHISHQSAGITGEVSNAEVINSKRFERLVNGRPSYTVAVVSVNGMVCDFCARGVEKAFAKDPDVLKIDVDLELGSVLIAYGSEVQPSERDIDKRIRSNGLDVVDIEIYRG